MSLLLRVWLLLVTPEAATGIGLPSALTPLCSLLGGSLCLKGVSPFKKLRQYSLRCQEAQGGGTESDPLDLGQCLARNSSATVAGRDRVIRETLMEKGTFV